MNRNVTRTAPAGSGCSAKMARALVVLLTCCTSCTGPPHEASSVARRLLDDSVDEAVRTDLARERVDDAADILAAMIEGMEPGTEEEYHRIPWLWRVSRAAGESNREEVIVEVLDVAAPGEGEPLHDWQAVVIGGGIVSGISAIGEWPQERIDRILAAHPTLALRYRRAVDLSAAMADDEAVPDPTRYDALRLVAMAGWDEASPQLIRYLGGDVHDELEMGAVSGLADIDAPAVDSVLLSRFNTYAPYNRHLALEGLLRTDERSSALLTAVGNGTIHPDSLGSDRIQRLRRHASESIRSRARALLPAR